MSSLADEIAQLTNPAPKIQDPEDDVNTETAAKVSEKFDEDCEFQEQVSVLRNRNAQLLEDLDTRYAGKRVSRKSLEEFNHKGDSETGSSDSEDEDSEDEDDKLFAEEINSFKQQMSEKGFPEQSGTENLVQSRESSENDMSENGSESSDSEDEIESAENETGDDLIQNFSRFDVHGEIEKGKAVKAQLELWNRFCDWRIQIQELLVVANKLPQFDNWKTFKEKADPSYSDNLNKGYNGVKNLLDNLLELQTVLLTANPETSVLEKNDDAIADIKVDDEEIPSDTDAEEENMDYTVKAVTAEPKSRKRKLKNDDYAEFLEKRHKGLIPYRNSVIQKWDEKIRLSTGRMTQKSFNSFDQSALKQIEQILQDKSRLIKRTQLKRSVYRVLGKTEVELENSKANSAEIDEQAQTVLKRDDHLKDYDPEIFDDSDFYHQLVKDCFESNFLGIDALRNSKMSEFQKERSRRNKKKVDVKSSKSRKTRFTVIQKLINFSAQVNKWTFINEAKDELFRSTFGNTTARIQT